VIYRSDPGAAPDSDFEPGGLAHLLPGNRGRLLDARRTPVTVRALAHETGFFEVEVGAFEDAGARWRVPVEDVGRFQFARGGALAGAGEVAALRAAAERFDRTTRVAADPAAAERTRARVAAERAPVRAALERAGCAGSFDLAGHVERREGDPRLFAALAAHLEEHGLVALDRAFAAGFVSNPWSGEVVKGHAIALAEMGLCPYEGKIVRDPGLFAGAWSAERRAAHLIVRMAFAQELWGGAAATVTLYRGAASEEDIAPPHRSSFVSATFSRAVAEAHFEGGPSTRAAVLVRREVPVERLVMSFLETEAMNARYREAEAVLVGDPAAGTSWL
jgi:hypothetical protein